MDDIWDFCSKFNQRIDEVEEVRLLVFGNILFSDRLQILLLILIKFKIIS